MASGSRSSLLSWADVHAVALLATLYSHCTSDMCLYWRVSSVCVGFRGDGIISVAWLACAMVLVARD